MGRVVNRMRAVRPGEVLREEYLAPLSLSVNALAMALGSTCHAHSRNREGAPRRHCRYGRAVGAVLRGRCRIVAGAAGDYDLKTLAARDDIARKVSPREAAPA